MARAAIAASSLLSIAVVAVPAGAKVPVPSQAVACLPGSTMTCLAVGQDSVTLKGAIARTTTSGAKWKSVAVPPGKQYFKSVICPTATKCIAVGFKGGLVSANGGKTWSKSSFDLGSPGKATLSSVACSTALDCFAAGTIAPPAGLPSGIVVRSFDGGVTWFSSLQTTPLGGMACTNATSCITVGRGIYSTVNTGLHWTVRNITGGLSSGLSSVACASASICFAVGPNLAGLHDATAPGEFVETTDGSQSDWSRVANAPAGTSMVSHIACSSGGACFAGGGSSTPGGAPSFALLASPTDQWVAATPPAGFSSIASLACPTATSCVAIGTSARGKGLFAVGTLTDATWAWVTAA